MTHTNSKWRAVRGRLVTLAGAAGLTLCAGLVAARSIAPHQPAPTAPSALQPDDNDAMRMAPAGPGAEGDSPESEAAAEELRFARSLSHAFERAADIIAPSVVNITTRSQVRYITGQTSLVDSGIGSGVIVSSTGYVLTNNHVIADAADAVVRLSDGREFEAELIGRDALRDLALLRIDADDLTPAVFAESDDVHVGEWVLAVGSPFGFSSTVTAGIVSAKGRGLGLASRAGIASPQATQFEDFIQTDAAINQGNSGGPLINLEGQVVGINSAIFSPSGGSVGIGFSIPSHLVRAVYDRLREGGTVGRGWVGVTVGPVDNQAARSAGLSSASGALIAGIVTDGPAAQSGLRQGDIVVSFNGRPVTDNTAFTAAIGIAAPGATARLDVVRDGAHVPVSLRIGDYDTLASLAAAQVDEFGRPTDPDSASAAVLTLYGLEFAEFNGRQRSRLEEAGVRGLLVGDVAAGRPVSRSGIRPGDVIMEVNGRSIRRAGDALQALAEGAKEGQGVTVRVYRPSEGRSGETTIRP